MFPRRKYEKTAVNTGVKFEKGFTFTTPICFTDQANNTKAQHEAKMASSRIGTNDFKVCGVEKKFFMSVKRNIGENSIMPIIF